MEELAINMIEESGYLGIFFLMIMENVFPPIPSEIVLSFAGFMAKKTELHIALVIIYASLGSLIGALILYTLGRKLGQSKTKEVINRYGKKIGFKDGSLEKAIRLYRSHQKRTVFFCRMLPVVRSLISIPAGFSGMNIFIFLGFTLLGSLIWNSFMIFLGYKMGELWIHIEHYMRYYSKIFLIVIIFSLILYILIRKLIIKREKR
ncbi:MAG: DedA family protein [Andreesenia angusta]|nr:DedA family protein [Andreesenia angusta]